ncbi:E3 ubiquitin-protein ligase MYCBP2 [Varanus komodoensis]|nr:E3 ubiquitin-protein ligase MYCBP2 [Varanus komodoensis]
MPARSQPIHLGQSALTVNFEHYKLAVDFTIQVDNYRIHVTLYLFLQFVLMENGDVYTFGYGQHGQLGHGDVNSRGCPTLVQALPGPSIQVTAGSNHTAVLLMDGQVFTFGSFSVRTIQN